MNNVPIIGISVVATVGVILFLIVFNMIRRTPDENNSNQDTTRLET